jgi:Protein of unknown function (DUF2975)
MSTENKTKTEQILTVLVILAWVAFIGYSIETGAILISFGVSFFNPDAAANIFKGFNLSHLRQLDFWYYIYAVSFKVALPLMKSLIWQLVIKTLSKINLTNPFTMEVARTLEKISYLLLGTWIVGMLNGAYREWLIKATGEIYETEYAGEFIFMAGLVFIISQIFKRGVEIQSENDLTV